MGQTPCVITDPGPSAGATTCRCRGKDPACCDGECADLYYNADHCGKCGKRCRRGKVCWGGECLDRCPENRKKCGRTCGNPKNQFCCGDKLADKGEGLKCCDGEIVGTDSNVCHCGECGHACAENMVCSGGKCVCPPGVTACFPLPNVHQQCR